ncbi:type I secretion system permease/ATPase [Falsirhodobacter sp. alg1]|uniref:type I secretion system permease/ATPase n=1 Tax=Falsirhodobacter sp. alg1 TaxID=1472418 RepID=UPI000788FFA4|nr:type I secretion system permease/ATPase [Falsirhodobacter sp. alg1]
MARANSRCGAKELKCALYESRGAIVAVAVFSVIVNLLMLTGPLYMMQVYDRVLPGRSPETLVALSALGVLLFAAMALLDVLRGRIMVRVGAAFQDRLDLRVLQASMRDPAGAQGGGPADLEAVQRFLASPVVPALFDLPGTPLFMALIFVFHPVLGGLALGGGVLLAGVTLLNRHLSRPPLIAAGQYAAGAEGVAGMLRSEGDVVRALGMSRAIEGRWQVLRGKGLRDAARAAELTGGFTATTRVMRLFLQSAMLGVGAWLVLHQMVGAGAMIACSILMGRALAPVETVIAQWSLVSRAQEGWQKLAITLANVQSPVPPLPLPRPAAVLQVEGVTAIPPRAEHPVLRHMSFALQPGQALGVIGPSGAGKTSLARVLTGVWGTQTGTVRLGGAALEQYAGDTLGAYVGYLPQRVALFDGTVAENIARMGTPDAARVIAAAREAAAHDMILRLPQGYDTPVQAIGGWLSGGEIQRIGLARALYGDPVLLVLDEPNSNLDNTGTEALSSAIRTAKMAGRVVVVIAHRPAAIQECDLLMVMEAGQRRAFGLRNDILRQMVRNHTEIVRPAAGSMA